MNYPKEINEFLDKFEPSPYAVFGSEDVSAINKKANKLRVKINNLNEELLQLTATHKSMCKHEDKMITTEYISGDYYNTATTYYRVVCKDCGTVLFIHSQGSKRYG